MGRVTFSKLLGIHYSLPYRDIIVYKFTLLNPEFSMMLLILIVIKFFKIIWLMVLKNNFALFCHLFYANS